jgi:hypothetical protein
MPIRGPKHIVLAIAIFCAHAARAQEVAINWADKSIQSFPSVVHKGETIKVTATDVNNVPPREAARDGLTSNR